MNEYPTWICRDCAHKLTRVDGVLIAYWRKDICGWCEMEKYVTDPKNFGYPPHPDRLKAKATGQGELL